MKAERTAADIMSRDVVSVSPDTTLREIANLLVEHGISGVPVVDRAGRVVGIVSEADLLNSEKRRVKLPRTALFGVFPLPDDLVRETFDEGTHLTAHDLMTRRVITLAADTAVRAVVSTMLERRVNRIPIVEDDKLVGIVTRNDALRAIQEEWNLSEG